MGQDSNTGAEVSDGLQRAMSLRGFFKNIQNPMASRVYQNDAPIFPIISSNYNKALGSLKDSINRLKVSLSNPIFSDGSESCNNEEYVTDIYYTNGNSELIMRPAYSNIGVSSTNKTEIS